jgi:hypothetical protein
MAVRLSALRTGRTLLPRNITIFMFLVIISGNFQKIIVYSSWTWPAKAETYSGEININKHLDQGTNWRRAVTFRLRPLYLRGKIPRCSLDRRLGEPHCRFGRHGEVKIIEFEFYCSVWIHCHGDVCTEPLPSSNKGGFTDIQTLSFHKLPLTFSKQSKWAKSQRVFVYWTNGGMV